MLDSNAVFKARAVEIGLGGPTLKRLDELEWNAYGKLAFASNYRPGQTDEGPLITLAEQVTQQSPPPPQQLPLIRRLVSESCAQAAADLKLRAERKEEDAPRKLAQAERAAGAPRPGVTSSWLRTEW